MCGKNFMESGLVWHLYATVGEIKRVSKSKGAFDWEIQLSETYFDALKSFSKVLKSQVKLE